MLRRLLVSFAVIVALVALGALAWALYWRARFPMDLEWLEGPQLCEAFRFAHGLPVYGPPGQGFVPSPYPPLFHLVVVGARAVLRVRLLERPPRLGRLNRSGPRRARPRSSSGPHRPVERGWVLAVLGAAAMAASYRPLEASMDLARVDMMGFALVGVAAWVARRSDARRGRAVALGVLLCAAVYTKQTNLFYVAVDPGLAGGA